ncbi:MAG: leucine-rich repeat domain-containing protein [Roseomonas sp.]|nr:leucine-rich repeat domain-containing protein [Roseomonas sp.]
MADMTDGERIAEKRIAEAARTGQDWLDLGGLGLTKLPDALSKLTKLKRLSLGDYVELTAESLGLRKGATERSHLSDLSVVSSLSELRELYIEGTNVSDLTPIKGLQQLQRLDCYVTQVSDLTAITDLKRLQFLDCSHTNVSDLTPIAELISLTRVDATGCYVGFVPNSIKNLKKLQFINLCNNEIKRLPRELGELGALETLFLDGNPLEDPLPKLIKSDQPQATINVLRWLRGEPIESEATEPDPFTPAEDADDPPAIPEQGAGPRVVLDQTGRLVFAKPSDLDARGNDRNRLEALHPALREAAADLAKALQDHPSNLRNERLLQKAEAYRALVDRPLDEVNFARLYGAGMQLLNAAGVTRRALEAGRVEVPDLTPVQDECLSNIENLHPPFVLASRDGQEMLADQTTIKLTAEAVEGIKEAGTELGAELINDPDLAHREVGETIRDAAAEIGQGENEARDAVNTVSTMRNAVIVLTTASKWAIIPAAVGFAAGGPPGAIAAGGATLWWYGAKVAEKTKAFQADADRAAKALDAEAEKLPIIRNRMARHQRLLLKVEPKLRKITQLPGFTWLGPSLDWLKRNSPADKKE